MARRVKAQMLFNLSQPQRAMQELTPTEAYTSNPYRSSSDFGTASNILEWKWIIARELGDTALMNEAGLRFAQIVE